MCLLSCVKNYPGVLFIILSFIKISNTLISDSFSSSSSEHCSFALNNGELIDLSPLVKDTMPLIASSNSSLYIYHPCKDVPLSSVSDNDCRKGYGLCYFVPKNPTKEVIDYTNAIQNIVHGNFSLLAFNAEAVFRENRLKQPEVIYKHSQYETVTTTIIRLECNENVENYKFTIVRTSTLEHELTLTSRYICVETPHYMSGGTVFFIILLTFIILYFVGGILVLKFIRGAAGVEMIPNHEFWCSLPQKFKNGFKYVTSYGKNSSDSYEKI